MTFVLILHALICVLLGIVILMQAGRRGGLVEAFSSTESMLGTKTASFMVRLTTIFCVLFFTISLGLAIASASKGKSLMSGADVRPKSAQAGEPETPKETETAKEQAEQKAADAAVATVSESVPAAEPEAPVQP